jgi:hypothetical protein
MIDEKPAPDTGSRMDFYTGRDAAKVGYQTGKEAAFADPKGMCKPVDQQSMKSRITENDFRYAAYGRIPLENRSDVLFQDL